MESVVLEFLQAVIVALLAVVGYFIKKTFDELTQFKTAFRPIPPAIVEIQGKFKDAGHNILFPVTVTPGSPLKLTEYGAKLVKDSGFDTLLANCRQQLVQRVKDKKPTTNYDIQEQSTALIEELLESGNDMLKPIKDYAFNSGIDVKILIPPAGILLRDEVMKELKF